MLLTEAERKELVKLTQKIRPAGRRAMETQTTKDIGELLNLSGDLIMKLTLHLHHAEKTFQMIEAQTDVLIRQLGEINDPEIRQVFDAVFPNRRKTH